MILNKNDVFAKKYGSGFVGDIWAKITHGIGSEKSQLLISSDRVGDWKW